MIQAHRRRLLQAAGLGAASLAMPAARAQTAATGYTLAVVPQFPAAQLHQDWTPLAERIGRELGITLALRLAPSIPRFEADMLSGAPDFIYGNPYHAVMAMRGPGYVPLVRDATALTGILVVRRDSPVKTVQALDGQTLAFPAPNSLGASLYMRALLAERERIQITPQYLQTHSNVYRQVIRGKAMAGGGVNKTLLQEPDEVRADLRVLMETPGVAPHPLAAHPRVPARVQQAFAEAWVKLAADAAGLALLKEVAMPQPVRADYGRDYRPLELLKLEKYVVSSPAA